MHALELVKMTYSLQDYLGSKLQFCIIKAHSVLGLSSLSN
jgi:hypothetical protein